MSIEKMFSTNKTFEAEGIWLDYGDEQVRIKRAGASNKQYGRVLSALMKPHKRAIERDSLDDEVAANVLHKAYARAVVVSWKSKNKAGKWVEGKMNKGGAQVEASEKNIIDLFGRVPEFFLDIKSSAEQVSLFKDEDVAETAGN